VGVAFSKPRNGRRDEYGIYKSPATAYGQPVTPSLYAQYEGYRKGDKQVGLPLGGPRWTEQPMIKFIPGHFGEVRFFQKSPTVGSSIRPARNITPAERRAAIEWLARRYRDQNLKGQISLKQYLSANLGFVVRNMRQKASGSPHPIRAIKRTVKKVGRAVKRVFT
jgi:hypothetical protein